MSIQYKFIGWCRTGSSDKVWGVIYLEAVGDPHFIWCSGAKCVTFWGRRGGVLKTKQGYDDYDLHKLVQSKQAGGYEEIDVTKLAEVYPEFEEDLQKTAMWEMLKCM